MKPKIVLVLLLGALAAYFAFFKEPENVSIGETAPSFRLVSKTGPVSLDEYRGKTVLLNFWATWCPPCLYEFPSLIRLKNRFKGDAFELLAVSIDEEGWGAVDPFIRTLQISFPILLDPQGGIASLYGAGRLPSTFLIDRQGKVVKKYLGPRDWDDPNIISEIEKYVRGS